MTELSPSRQHALRTAFNMACRQVGLNPDGAELVKYTVNAVYRLAGGQNIVARIGIGALGQSRALRVVHASQWLRARGAPVTELTRHHQPVSIQPEYHATFWCEWQPFPDQRKCAAALATVLQQLHAIPVERDDLASWDPFTAAKMRLDSADSVLGAADRTWLRSEWTRMHQEYREAFTTMKTGVVHGDAHIGNLLKSPDGKAALCDLDSAGIGPLAWDLVPAAVGERRFGARDFYPELAHAYGWDVTREPYWPVLARIRELILVTSALPDLVARPEMAREHASRLESLRTGSDAQWHPYV